MVALKERMYKIKGEYETCNRIFRLYKSHDTKFERYMEIRV